jgi:hypothetical protein
MDPNLKRRLYDRFHDVFERYGYASELDEVPAPLAATSPA